MKMSSIPSGSSDREIVVALVTALGCPADDVENALKDAFAEHDYVVSGVRISELLDQEVPDEQAEPVKSKSERLMNKGDMFRAKYDSDGACSYMAAQQIAIDREAATGSPDMHRAKHVTLVRSLKTVGEVKVLRQIYGPRVIVIGVGASPQERTGQLIKQLRRTMQKDDAERHAEELISRDEKDERKYGQRMRAAYQLADAFIASEGSQVAPTATRLVRLLLGDPFITPNRDEQGMFSAWGARFRSSAAGRQVGAALVDAFGEVVALGCNDVPRPGGGQYWTGDTKDRRDWALGADANDRGKHGAAASLLEALSTAGWLAPKYSQTEPSTLATIALEDGGPLDLSEFSGLIEYGRIVHAEMAALMTAARSGRSVLGCTLYTTTYPCHECARLIIAAGIGRVCYVDAYPKSRASQLYEEMWTSDARGDAVRVEQFTGVSPRMFATLFEASNRTKDVNGDYKGWIVKQLQVEDEELADSIPNNERAAAYELLERGGLQGNDAAVQRDPS